MSTAYHPQTDGQTERVNQCLEGYLRCMCSTNPKAWAQWLPTAEFWYNTNFHTTTLSTPFTALYGYSPSVLTFGPYLQTTVLGVEEAIQAKQEMIYKLRTLLTKAQHRMIKYANKGRTERVLAEGDWVYLKLRPYKQVTLHKTHIWKLSPKYAGPFRIVRRVGEVAYTLDLPSTAKVHPTFHVSLLKRKVGRHDMVSSNIPELDDTGKVLLIPVQILARRLVNRGGSPATELLIQWAHLPESEATWEDIAVIREKFPALLA